MIKMELENLKLAAAGGKKKKGKKKKGGDEDVKEKPLIIGPTECVLRFDEFYEDYTQEWANRDERENKEQ